MNNVVMNVRFNIYPCSFEETEKFIASIDKNVYIPCGTSKSSGASHYDRYYFVRDNAKVTVVLDTSAFALSITANEEYATELLNKFGVTGDKTVKRSLVPGGGAQPVRKAPQKKEVSIDVAVQPDTRAKLFVAPDTLKKRMDASKTSTVIATAKGLEISTDEIFPPQRMKRREENAEEKQVPRVEKETMPSIRSFNRSRYDNISTYTPREKAPSVEAYFADKEAQTKRTVGRPRKAVISIGCDDEDNDSVGEKTFVRNGTGVFSDISSHTRPAAEAEKPQDPPKKKRGRPRKVVANADIVQPPALREQNVTASAPAPEYKNGYSVKNYSEEKLSALINRLESAGYAIKKDSTEFSGTSQEVRTYIVIDSSSKVNIRYATKKMTVALQGRRSELFAEVQSQMSCDTDYSSALEGYVESGTGTKSKVSEVEKKLKKRLPNAYEYLSEQSRIDFSYGIHDFDQQSLVLSDYSVLLVPPFRGLERFVFDLQRAEDIHVKMIGQAFDKDADGKYILKSGYSQRIGSIIYSEVMVALYTEYFSRRNFFAHSDNSDDSRPRAITDRNTAKEIFEHLLDTVEYNAAKLKEIGFSMEKNNRK